MGPRIPHTSLLWKGVPRPHSSSLAPIPSPLDVSPRIPARFMPLLDRIKAIRSASDYVTDLPLLMVSRLLPSVHLFKYCIINAFIEFVVSTIVRFLAFCGYYSVFCCATTCEVEC